MKNTSAFLSLAVDARRTNLAVAVATAAAISVVLGMLLTDTTDELIAYLLVTTACAAPAAVWIRAGTPGVPVMPAVSLMYFVYYGVPILRKNATLMGFAPSEVLSAAVTVFLFLMAATISWGLVLFSRAQKPRSAGPNLISGSQLERIMFFGLGLGAFYLIALYSGWLNGLGSFFGVARSACLTTATVACFMLGHARAKGSLQGRKWALAVAGLGLIVLLSWISLFLVGGVMFCLGAVLGYVITAKRVPWAFLAATIAAVIVLHAGKDDMRYKYWERGKSYVGEISVFQAPAIMAEWVGTGLSTIASGGYYDSAIDRASLLSLLLKVQRLAPDYVPFLEGKTYAVLPDMLVPRFLDPDKISSQAAMNMLNVEYGFQTAEGTQKTAVGWGLIAEAYANFGRLGVIGVALVLGLLAGSLERWSIGASLISLPSLVAVAVLMQLINLEGDAAGLVTTISQSIMAISIYFWVSGALSKHRKPLRHQAVASGQVFEDMTLPRGRRAWRER